MALADEKIPGACPRCYGKEPDPECSLCGGKREVQFGIAKGFAFTQHCNSCGEDNGMSIRETRDVEGQRVVYGNSIGQPLGPPDDTPVPCVWCRGTDVVWLLLGRTDDE